MFDPTRRLIKELANAIDKKAPRQLREADVLAHWAKREHETSWLLLDGDGRWWPFTTEQIAAAAQLVAQRRRDPEGNASP